MFIQDEEGNLINAKQLLAIAVVPHEESGYEIRGGIASEIKVRLATTETEKRAKAVLNDLAVELDAIQMRVLLARKEEVE